MFRRVFLSSAARRVPSSMAAAAVRSHSHSLSSSSAAGRVPAGPKPFRVLGLQQVALGAPEKGPLQELWADVFGLKKVKTFVSERENVDEDVMVLGRGPEAVEIDLMAPLDPARKPRVDQPPLNHIGLWIDDLPKAVEWLSARGVRFAPGGIRPGATGHNITFIHPKGNDEFPLSGCGVLIELVQAPKDVIDAFDSKKE